MKIIKVRSNFIDKRYDGIYHCEYCRKVAQQHISLHIDIGLRVPFMAETAICRQCWKKFEKALERDKANNSKRYSQQTPKTKAT